MQYIAKAVFCFYTVSVYVFMLVDKNFIKRIFNIVISFNRGLTREGVSSSLAVVLQYTVKPVVANQQCNVSYAGRITHDMLCAGLPQGGRDACQGDRYC